MNAAAITPARPAAFSKAGALALVGGGFLLFLAMLWLIGSGAELGGSGNRGEGHAAANGLNGYSGLVRLVEAQGYAVERSRSRAGLATNGLLVLAPPHAADADAVADILTSRVYQGPTLLIVPKWQASAPGQNMSPEARGAFKRGWVTLEGTLPARWAEDLPAPYTFTHAPYPKDAVEVAQGAISAPLVPAPPQPRWRGMGTAGKLPTPAMMFAVRGAQTAQEPLITDPDGRVLAFSVTPQQGGKADPDAYPVIVLAEPDLANNYGLADPARAAAAIALVDALTDDGEIEDVTFDMTLNGFGASENLLTLAFRPPFLAATLSLLAALLIVGWRAFLRFGPAAAPAGPDIAFGKRQLITNGAGLILRARRFGLLGRPYAALAARRIADRLGLARADAAAIDSALARRLPQEEPFTARAARLEAARTPSDLVAAARNLDDLATRLTERPR